jgi:endonuclease YncB( thermonuclease family)
VRALHPAGLPGTGLSAPAEVIQPAYIYRASCVRVIDGDTLVLRVDLGLRCSVEIEARVHGIDTPELRTHEGQMAKEFVEHLIPGLPLVVQTYKDQRSFARWVCDVHVGGESLADLLRTAGYEKTIQPKEQP